MPNQFRKNKFTNVSNILPKVVEKLGLDKRLNEQALFHLWPSLVDQIYARRSRPLYIDNQHILLVGVEDSATAQELSFLKPKLIKKLKQIGTQLDLKIDGIRFDIKQFHSARDQSLDKAANITMIASHVSESELQALSLSESENNEIAQFKIDLKDAVQDKSELCEDEDLFSQRLVNLIERKIRLKKWHKTQNLPFCKQCNEAMFQTGVLLCHYCLQQKQSGSQYDNNSE